MKLLVRRILSPLEAFSGSKLLVIILVLVAIGVGVVLVGRAQFRIYKSNWAYWGPRIRGCESGSGPTGAANYAAQNATSTAGGAYQFLDSTWGRYKGYAKARLAPAAVQEEKAFATFMDGGTSAWDASYFCWQSNDTDAQNRALVSILKDNQQPNTDLEPLIPGVQDVVSQSKVIKIVNTPPADGLDPYIASPIVQFLRFLGFLRV